MIDAEFFGVVAQRRVETITLALGLAGGVAALYLHGWPEAVGFALGALAAWLNFRWLKQFVHWVGRIAMAGEGVEKPKMPLRVYLQLFGRYALLGLVLYAMLMRFYWPILAFLCGLFTLIAAVLLEVIGELLYSARRGMLT